MVLVPSSQCGNASLYDFGNSIAPLVFLETRATPLVLKIDGPPRENGEDRRGRDRTKRKKKRG